MYLKHPPHSSSRVEAKLGVVVIHHNVCVIANTQLKVEREITIMPDSSSGTPDTTMEVAVAMVMSGAVYLTTTTLHVVIL